MTKETRKKLESAFYEYKKNRNISICETLNCIASKHLTTNYDKIPVKSSGINCAEDSIIRLLDANTERYNTAGSVDVGAGIPIIKQLCVKNFEKSQKLRLFG